MHAPNRRFQPLSTLCQNEIDFSAFSPKKSKIETHSPSLKWWRWVSSVSWAEMFLVSQISKSVLACALPKLGFGGGEEGGNWEGGDKTGFLLLTGGRYCQKKLLHHWRTGQVRSIMKQRECLFNLRIYLHATQVTAIILLRLLRVVEWFSFALHSWKGEEKSLPHESTFFVTYSTQGLFYQF